MIALDNSATMDRFVEIVRSRTGFRSDSISCSALSKVLQELLDRGNDLSALLRRAEAADPEVIYPLVARTLIGETYFFRHPEHFAYVQNAVMPALIASGVSAVRAWSAGCATGEEAYSIASCLLACLPKSSAMTIEVLGTDLLAENIAIAKKALYGAWSLRSLPQLHPTLESAGSGRAVVLPQVRRLASFFLHNLLDSPEHLGKYHLILCRNVLVYFDDESAEKVCAHLASALAPGGTLVFSAMDCRRIPCGLVQVGSAESTIYQKPIVPIQERPPIRRARGTVHGLGHQRHTSRPTTAPRQPSSDRKALPPPDQKPPQIALHLRVLSALEAGDARAAGRLLTELTDMAPDYIPGLLEQALLLARQGRVSGAVRLMREILARIDSRGAQDPVEGPEILPIAYYRTTVTVFLEAASENAKIR